jgi:hypothetical protein
MRKIKVYNRNQSCDASTTGSSTSFSSTYIVFVTKMQKRQIPEKGFALFKNDITTSESTF